MADVLIVCVREDEPLAKAFADMFERAGLHVGGAPGAVDDMRACGAALVVWSQASIRSRAFLDAAQRSVNAGKAVVACLIAPPPPASINHAPAFDLSRWTGDPDDPVLDPLFFAVDRMVAAQRQSAGIAAPAGAAPARADPRADPPSAYFTQPAPPPAPPYARARASTPAPQQPAQRAAPAARQPASRFEQSPPRAAPTNPRRTAAPPPMSADQDLVAAEAQNWAAIRHSRNPEDFLRHLADFSASGAFAELAQMKLAELEAEARRRRQPPAAIARQDSLRGADAVRLDPTRAPAARAPAPRETARQAPRPPPAQFEPIRSDSPATSRRGAPPQRQEPPAWRDEGRAATRRPEPARGGGGGMRLILLILLLGGAALGLGLFAGDRFGLFGMIAGTDRAGQQTDEAAWQDGPAAADQAAASSESGSALDASEIASAPIESGPRETAAPRAETRASPERTPPREEARRAPDPQQLTTTTTTTSGAPAQSAAATPAPILPPLPEVQIQSAAITPPPTAQRANTPPAAPTRPPAVIWTQRPTASALGNLFPTRAVRSNTTGRVELNCLLDAAGVPRCAVARETPSGYGFGAAALRAAAQFRARPTLDDGTPSSGAQTRLTIVFRPPAL